MMKMSRIILDVKKGFEKLLFITYLFVSMFFLQVVRADEPVKSNYIKDDIEVELEIEKRLEIENIKETIKKEMEYFNAFFCSSKKWMELDKLEKSKIWKKAFYLFEEVWKEDSSVDFEELNIFILNRISEINGEIQGYYATDKKDVDVMGEIVLDVARFEQARRIIYLLRQIKKRISKVADNEEKEEILIEVKKDIIDFYKMICSTTKDSCKNEEK